MHSACRWNWKGPMKTSPTSSPNDVKQLGTAQASGATWNYGRKKPRSRLALHRCLGSRMAGVGPGKTSNADSWIDEWGPCAIETLPMAVVFEPAAAAAALRRNRPAVYGPAQVTSKMAATATQPARSAAAGLPQRPGPGCPAAGRSRQQIFWYTAFTADPAENPALPVVNCRTARRSGEFAPLGRTASIWPRRHEARGYQDCGSWTLAEQHAAGTPPPPPVVALCAVHHLQERLAAQDPGRP